MSREALLRSHLDRTLSGLEGTLSPTHRGKVRDVFDKGAELLLVASDRISAFDVVLSTIPFKGQLLTEQSAFWLHKAASVVPTHLVERVDPQVLRCKKAAAFPVEFVVRGYLAGSLMRAPPTTRGARYGLHIDPAIQAYQAFPDPVLTPTTKEAVGLHDEPCSPAELVSSGRIAQGHLDRCVEVAMSLFRMGQEHARRQGLILVDTKYEMGLVDGAVTLIDEIHTADSSRFWVAGSYAERIARGEAPEMLDKERLRLWLLSQGYTGYGTPPTLTDDVRVDLADHYWTLTERVMGLPFLPVEGDAAQRVGGVVRSYLQA